MAEKIIFAITIVLLKTFVLSQRHSTLVRVMARKTILFVKNKQLRYILHHNSNTIFSGDFFYEVSVYFVSSCTE